MRLRALSLPLLLWIQASPAAAVFPGETWSAREPAELALRESPLAQLAARVGGHGVIVRDGYLVYSWGNPARRSDISSAAKPIYAHFLLQAVDQGLLTSPDELVAPYVACADPNDPNRTSDPNDPNASGAPSPLDGITFRHLARQISGYGRAEAPGEAFAYNDYGAALLWDALFLGVYGATYETVDAAVLEPLVAALGLEDSPTFLAFGPTDRPGRMKLSPRDLARFGVLYLNAGRWNGTPLVDASWATRVTSDPLPADFPRTGSETAPLCAGQRTLGGGSDQSDHHGSHSWFWWTNGMDASGERLWPDAPADAYGAFGHWGERVLFLLPEQQIAVAFTDAGFESIAATNAGWALLLDAVCDPDPDAGAEACAASVGALGPAAWLATALALVLAAGARRGRAARSGVGSSPPVR